MTGRRLPTARRVLVLVARVVVRAPRYLLVGVFRLWQLLVSPTYGQTCRFYPSCSAYGVEAVSTHGAVKGLALTVWRILRCNPWNSGGVDPVPPRGRAGEGHHDLGHPAAGDPTSLHEAQDPASETGAAELQSVAVVCSDDSAPLTRRAA